MPKGNYGSIVEQDSTGKDSSARPRRVGQESFGRKKMVSTTTKKGKTNATRLKGGWRPNRILG